MNMRRDIRAIDVSEGVRKDVSRIEELWADALEKSGGPFLMGRFSNVDAMYAPVVNRFHVYELARKDGSQAYMQLMMGLAAYNEWAEAAESEPWVVEEEEV